MRTLSHTVSSASSEDSGIKPVGPHWSAFSLVSRLNGRFRSDGRLQSARSGSF